MSDLYTKGGFRKLIDVFNQHKHEADVVNCNQAMNAYCNLGQTEQAAQLLRDMSNSTISAQPNDRTYSGLIDAYCKELKLDNAFDLLNTMIKNGVKPSEVNFSSMMDKLCKFGTTEQDKELLAIMKQNGTEPNVNTYNMLINGHRINKDVSGAINVFKEMLDTGIKPNEHTFVSLIDRLAKSGKMDGVEEVLVTWSQLG